MICDYGCGQQAKYKFKNGKLCCSENHISCPALRQKVKRNVAGVGNPRYGKKLTQKTKDKISNTLKGKMAGKKNPFYGKKHTKISREKMSKSLKIPLEEYRLLHPLLFKVEEIRMNLNSRKIEVHCKNHRCLNSKEKGGWFSPTQSQLTERIRALENPSGMTENNFYCSDKCKRQCPLYRIRRDPFQIKKEIYTSNEYQIFREYVLKRDNYKCQFCGEKATDVHHERPQKLEPFFALDPDFAWSCCKKCHYEKGHIDECSTGKIASKVCH